MNIRDIYWKELHTFRDHRGNLTAIEGSDDVPFEIKRVFYMHNVAPGSNRGGHTHRDTDQVAVAVHGSLRMLVTDGVEARLCVLDDPSWGLVLPRMIWARLMDFTEDAVCLVLANTHFDMARSIRTWPEYLSARGLQPSPEPTGAELLPREATLRA